MRLTKLFRSTIPVSIGFWLAPAAPAHADGSAVALVVNQTLDSALVRRTSPTGRVSFESCALHETATSVSVYDECRVLRDAEFDAGDAQMLMRLNAEFLRNFDQSYRMKAYRYVGAAAIGGGLAGAALSTPKRLQNFFTLRHRDLAGGVRVSEVTFRSKPFANYILAGVLLGLVARGGLGILRSRWSRAELGTTSLLQTSSSALIMTEDDFDLTVAALADALARVVPRG